MTLDGANVIFEQEETESEPKDEETGKEPETAVTGKTGADEEPEKESEAEVVREYYPTRRKGKKGRKGKGYARRQQQNEAARRSAQNTDSNAKEIEAAANAVTTAFRSEPKPTSIDELEDGVIFNTSRDDKGTPIKREPIVLTGEQKGRTFDFTDIE